MVYYNPYKKIFRALMRSVRVFISSLFSKRLLLMIIVVLIIMLLHLNVHAESIYQDGYAYRNIKNNGYDQELDCYSFDYRVYNKNGLQEGSVNVPSSIYNKNSWIMFITEYGNIRIFIKENASNTETTNLYCNRIDNNYYWSWTKNSTSITNFTFYDLSPNSSSFTLKKNNSNVSEYWSYYVTPQSILFSKNMNLIYYDRTNNISYDYSSCMDNRVLKTPNLRFYTGTGFRLYLKDFEPFSSSEYIDWDKNYSSDDTVKLYFSVFDINNQTYSTNLQEITLQDYDDDGNLYVDILFSNLQYMNFLDGDYLLFFATYLTNTREMDNLPFNFDTKYSTLDYWRYTYYADSGAGILRAVYEDGTEKPNQDNTSTDEPSQEDTTSQAITELNNTINNQTTIIQEQTNTINDMSDFMQDDNFSSDTITDNMPNSNDFQNITENGFDNIFTTLRNTFTSSNYQDVVFTVPFSNGQTITLPSNLTENIIPIAIINLIQMVYWYFIARFIVKDIASYIEKAKSGDIFNSSDTNIKTDML